jgi:hypothetical protein
MKVESWPNNMGYWECLREHIGNRKETKKLPLSLLIDFMKFIFAKSFLTYYDGLFNNVWQGWVTLSLSQKQKV